MPLIMILKFVLSKGKKFFDQGNKAPFDKLKEVSGTIRYSSKKLSMPNPSHFLQAPVGALNENNLGSTSAIVKPETGHEKILRKNDPFIFFFFIF